MLRVAALLLVAVELGGGFGDASATVISTSGESMQVELHVAVESSAESVLAHLALPGEETITLPLLPRDSGSYGITTELKQADYQVVFEILGPTSLQSQAVSLSALGAELAGGARLTTTTEEASAITEETTDWMWLAVAFAAASLSALAFWVLGGRDRSDAGEDQSSSDSEAASV